MVDFEALARPGIQRLRAYDPGHDLVALRRRFVEAQLVELGSNENPYGASPKAKQAVVDALAGIHIYPDPLGGDLKRALARHHGIATANLLLGNGSHELLMQFAQVFAGPGDEVVASKFGACQFPPVSERVGIRVAADGIGQQLHAAIGTALSLLGEEVHALVLGEDDAALVGNGLGQHGAQVGTFESQ